MTAVNWRPCYRIVPSRFPLIDLFERVASPDDWDLLHELEGSTSARLREEAGEIHLVREEDRRYGPGWTPVMAAFCHFSGIGTRFTDGTFGAYYTALSEATAIAETRYHTERFLRESDEPPMQVQQRVYLANLAGELHDLRGDPPGAGAPIGPRRLERQPGLRAPGLGEPQRRHCLPQRASRWRRVCRSTAAARDVCHVAGASPWVRVGRAQNPPCPRADPYRVT